MNGKNDKTQSFASAVPFPVPPSLESHIELYDSEPGKALKRLKQHLRRRGNDPVGYMLLAFMYQQRGDQKSAISYALNARIFAPGSLFMQKLPYYLSHPDRFEAWIKEEKESVTPRQTGQNDFLKDIDQLIEVLSNTEPRRIRLKEDSNEPLEDKVEATNKMALDVATETLASIYEMQGNTQKAIDTYKRIAKRDPAREKYCDQHIKRLAETDKKTGN